MFNFEGEDLITNSSNAKKLENPDQPYIQNNGDRSRINITRKDKDSGEAPTATHSKVLFDDTVTINKNCYVSGNAKCANDYTGLRPTHIDVTGYQPTSTNIGTTTQTCKEAVLLPPHTSNRPSENVCTTATFCADTYQQQPILQLDSRLRSVLNNHPRLIDFDLVKQQHARIKSTWPAIAPEAMATHSEFGTLYQRYFLRFGWPVGYDNQDPPTSVDTNHHSAQKDALHVANFIKTEMSHGALVGPFEYPPFQPWTRVSPLLTRPKKDSLDKRIIVDLSYPEGAAVNSVNTDLQLCMYAQYLKNSHPAPQRVKNYMSGAKTWVAEHGGLIQPFLSRELDQLTKGFVKNSSHVPKRAFPLSVPHLLLISDYVRSNPSLPFSVLPCVVIGFKCFLRSSNLLSPSMQVWGGPHTLLARDLMISNNQLLVSISSTKTKWDNRPETFVLDREQDQRICPVALWAEYSSVFRRAIFGPAFLTNEHLPFTAHHVVGTMRAALASLPDIDQGRLSLHSLRRGAAQDAVDKGAGIQEIKTLGLWKTDSGLKPYLS